MSDGSGRSESTCPLEQRDGTGFRTELGRFGLTDTEIDTYLVVLTRGEATTSAVAEDADVTQRAVYDIAERLQQRGLVRVRDHASPTTVRAIPPEEAIGNLSAKLESLTPALADRFNDDADSEAAEIQIVKSRETAIRRLRTAISEAGREVLIAVPEQIYPEIEPDLRAAVERDLLVLLLLGETEVSDGDDHRFDGVASVGRTWNAGLPFLYAVDGKSAMIGDSAILSSPRGDSDAVTVSQSYLTGAVLGLYLSAYWPAAAEMYVADPDPLPRSFDWFRQAVFQAVVHDRRGTDLRADVETLDGAEMSGPVRQVRQALVEPSTNEFTLETSLYLETVDGVRSFGGPGSFIEDYQVDSLTLRECG